MARPCGNRAERAARRMFDRGREAGYRAGRYGEHTACPYPKPGLPRRMWLEGYLAGYRLGRADLAAVRASYITALNDLDNEPQRGCWL